MTLPAEVQQKIAPYLRLLGSGWLPIAQVQDRFAAPAMAHAMIRLPAGTRSLFLRLGPVRGSEQTVRVLANGRVVQSLVVKSPDTWALVPVRGWSELTLETPEAGATEPCLHLFDIEAFAHDISATYDLTSARTREDRFLTVRMDLTNKCNLRCRMCCLSFDEVFYQPKDYMSADTFAKFGSQVLPVTSHISLSAGFEPLLHPEFAKVLEVVASHRVPYVDFTTNGTLITRAIMDALIDARVSTVTFSVDGAEAETYEHIRRGSQFARFKKGLELFAAVKRERGVNHPALSFNMVLMRRNIDELAAVMRLGAEYGLELMHTALLVPHKGLRMEPEALQHDRERANRAFAEARKTAAELSIFALIPADFDLTLPVGELETLEEFSGMTLCEEWMGEKSGADFGDDSTPPAPSRSAGAEPAPELLPSVGQEHTLSRLDAAAESPAPRESMSAASTGPSAFVSTEQDDAPSMVPRGSATRDSVAHDGTGAPVRAACPYPWTMAVLRPDGAVVPCCHWIDPTVMGKLPEQSFEEVWNGPEYRQLRLELQTERFRPACALCPERRRI